MDPAVPRLAPWRRALQVALTLAVLYLAWRLAAGIAWRELVARLGAARPGVVALAVAALAGRWWIWARRWSLALQRLSIGAGRWLVLRVVVASVLVNHIIPGRVLGGVVRARYLARFTGERFSRPFASVVFDQVVHHAVGTVITWAAVVGVAAIYGRPLVAAGAVALFAAAAVAALGRRPGSRRPAAAIGQVLAERARKIARLERVVAGGRDMASALRQLFAGSDLLARAALLSAFFFAGTILGQTLLFRALGLEVSIWTVAAVTGLGGFVGGATGTPGGFGSTEAAMVAGYAALGVAEVDAVAATLLFRGLHYVLVLVLGVPAFVPLELASRRRRPEAAASSEPGTAEQADTAPGP